jgi:hypothetical protein
MVKQKLHPTVQLLLAEIEAYRNRAGIDRTNFGIQAMHDGNFIPRLESGRQPKYHTIDRVRAFINKRTKAVTRSSQPTRKSNVL